MWGVILVQAVFIAVFIITTETVLSLLRLGVEPPNPDLGQMLSDGTHAIYINASEIVFPSIAITILILGFTSVAEGLRDAVVPRSQG